MIKNRIKVFRAIHDLTQEQLAQKIGVSRQTINSIEKGKFVPSVLIALKMSKLFGVTVNEIFSIESEEENE